jgi:putative phosphoribosyl transferase
MTMQPPLWSTRHQAGIALAERLQQRAGHGMDSTILGLPRGGIPVAVAMAERLRLPVATWSVRKVVDPLWPELAIGAIATGGVAVWRNGQAAADRAARARQLGWLQDQERELVRRQRLFGDPVPEELRFRHLIVVDDGIATGMTVKAALLSLRQVQPLSLTLAVPVVDRSVEAQLAPLVDHLEALAVVDQLEAVGLWYKTFNQLSDSEVLGLLEPWMAAGSVDRPQHP